MIEVSKGMIMCSLDLVEEQQDPPLVHSAIYCIFLPLGRRKKKVSTFASSFVLSFFSFFAISRPQLHTHKRKLISVRLFIVQFSFRNCILDTFFGPLHVSLSAEVVQLLQVGRGDRVT